MILLDSDHLSALRYRSGTRAIRLTHRLSSTTEVPIGTTTTDVEEAMRGWMAAIAKERLVPRQIPAYRKLAALFGFFSGYHTALFDEEAAVRFEMLKSERVRVGSMDLKTASTTLAQNALLLTANKRDFEKVPGLRFKNWIDTPI